VAKKEGKTDNKFVPPPFLLLLFYPGSSTDKDQDPHHFSEGKLFAELPQGSVKGCQSPKQ
jgi:hypothetical protein